MPYQVFGDNCGAVAVTVTCTRSASARSSGAISAMLSRTACRPSAALAPFLPSARNSAARIFIAARSSALKPPDSVLALFAGILGLPFLTLMGSGSCRPSTERLGPTTPWRFSIPDRIGAQPRRPRSVAERFLGPREHVLAGSGRPGCAEDGESDRDGHAEQSGGGVDLPRAEHGGDRSARQQRDTLGPAEGGGGSGRDPAPFGVGGAGDEQGRGAHVCVSVPGPAKYRQRHEHPDRRD